MLRRKIDLQKLRNANMWKIVLITVLLYSCNAQTTRKYFIAGAFSNAYNTSDKATTVNVNGIAVYDLSLGWTSMNGGVDAGSTVNKVYVDACGNVYIAGTFANAGGVATGPIAVWRIGTSNWAPISTSFSTGSSVTSITVDCNSSLPSCTAQCDIYIVGTFSLSISSDVTANNFAAFIGGKWNTSPSTIRSPSLIYKNENSVASPLVFIGGSSSSPLQIANVSDFNFTSVSGITGSVNAFYYDQIYYEANTIIVGGDFSSGSGCVNLCAYNFVTGAWSTIVNSQVANIGSAVTAIDAASENTLYVTGAFPQQILIITRSTGAVSSFLNAPASNVVTMNVCSDGISCTTGSVLLGGQDSSANYIIYFDASSARSNPLRGGVDGNVLSVTSHVYSNGSFIPGITLVGSDSTIAPSPSASTTAPTTVAPSSTPTITPTTSSPTSAPTTAPPDTQTATTISPSTSAPTTSSPTTVQPSTTALSESPSPTTSSATPTPATNQTLVIDVALDQTYLYIKIFVPVGVGLGLLLICAAVISIFLYRRYLIRKATRGLRNLEAADIETPKIKFVREPTESEPLVPPVPSQEQEQLSDLVKRLKKAVKNNKFGEVGMITEQMDEMATKFALDLPNPSNIFIQLIHVMNIDAFQHCDMVYMNMIVRVVHKFASLSLLEKTTKHTKFPEEQKINITRLLELLRRMTDEGKNMELRFHIDCIQQCVAMMEDTTTIVDRVLETIGNVRNLGKLLSTLDTEIVITPKMWYQPLLITSLLTYASQNDEQALLSIMRSKIWFQNTDNWRLFFNQAILLASIVKKATNEKIAMLALTGNNDIELTEEKKKNQRNSLFGKTHAASEVMSLSTLLSFSAMQKSSYNAYVRVRAFREVFDIANRSKLHSIKSTAVLLLLDRRIHETHPNVCAIMLKAFSRIQECNFYVQWRQEIAASAAVVVKEIDSEWEELQLSKSRRNNLKREMEEYLRTISNKNTELETLQSRIEEKMQNAMYKLEEEMYEQKMADLKQVKKEEMYETDEKRLQIYIRRRIELEEVIENMQQMDRVLKMKAVVKNVRQDLIDLEEKYNNAASDANELAITIKKAQREFNEKRKNFETVQEDYRIATLLAVQELENKTRSVEGTSRHTNVDVLPEPRASRWSNYGSTSHDSDEEIPSDFVCPITCDVFMDPVLLIESGNNYERAAIERWLASNDKEPLTGMPLKNKSIMANMILASNISEWKLKSKRIV
jgi:hypothetical protein